MLDLIIITGASKGIGFNIANNCFNYCKTLIAIASSNKIDNLVCGNKSCDFIPLQLDLQDYNNTYNQILNKISNLKINSLGIVLCASQIGEHGGLLETNLDNFDKLYKCNFIGNLAVIKGCSKLIKSGIKTRIVFFGGGGGAGPFPEFFQYSCSKVATIRAVENLSIELSKINNNVSVIAIAPGAVATDMLKVVEQYGGTIRTRTTIDEPTNFVNKFLCDEFPSLELNGKLLHVRDDIKSIDFSNNNLFKLRRVE